MSNRRKLKRTPAALAREDQVRAASRQVSQGLLITAALAGLTMSGEPSGPIGQRVDDWRKADQERRITEGCGHLATPQPVVGLLSDPGRIYCADCGPVEADHLALLDPDGCDACGLRTKIFREVILGGQSPMMIVGHVCSFCYAAALR